MKKYKYLKSNYNLQNLQKQIQIHIEISLQSLKIIYNKYFQVYMQNLQKQTRTHNQNILTELQR